MSTERIARRLYIVAGRVQGVGFRPFVWRLAKMRNLGGFVRNTSHGVRIEVQGREVDLDIFAKRLLDDLPPLARITDLSERELELAQGEEAFRILQSEDLAGQCVLAAPDMAPCPNCLREMRDPKNPRHAYPFISCTNCGPRFSIIRSLPYDRPATTMGCFALCDLCARQYADPADRRFHAQPVACPACGPQAWFVRDGANDTAKNPANMESAIERAANFLLAGKILAIKGLGGFQLACDATNAEAVLELRARKSRPSKALAVMVASARLARNHCELSARHLALLESPERPIVLCPKKRDSVLVSQIAPDNNDIGLMLPATPLHELLFDRLGDTPMVMTSANPSGEPLCLGNREALERLAGIADGWLLHDRDILARVDDSVIRAGDVPGGYEFQFLRRARGYVPSPIKLPLAAPPVLGMGAELKATFCLTRNDDAFVSQHIGDLQNLAVLDFYEQMLAHFEKLLEVSPKALVHDLHPDFMSGRLGRELAKKRGIPAYALQHHAAHAASVLAEHGALDDALCLCLDGTGMGSDGSVWGGEIILMNAGDAHWQRVGRLAIFPLPGGDEAARNPWRIARALRKQCGIFARLPVDEKDLAAVDEMLRLGLNSPQSSSLGRLFDAVSAQLGLCMRITYEGEAAIKLESAAANWLAMHSLPKAWDIAISEKNFLHEIASGELFSRVCELQDDKLEIGEIAAAFHVSVARAFVACAENLARKYGIKKIGLTGGVFQNALMAKIFPEMLLDAGLEPLMHVELPPGDGGLALGQAFFGQRLLATGKLQYCV